MLKSVETYVETTTLIPILYKDHLFSEKFSVLCECVHAFIIQLIVMRPRLTEDNFIWSRTWSYIEIFMCMFWYTRTCICQYFIFCLHTCFNFKSNWIVSEFNITRLCHKKIQTTNLYLICDVWKLIRISAVSLRPHVCSLHHMHVYVCIVYVYICFYTFSSSIYKIHVNITQISFIYFC